MILLKKAPKNIFLIVLVVLSTISMFMYARPVRAANNINFSIDSDSLPPALQDIIKSIAGIQRIAVSGSFSSTSSTDWYFSGNIIIETTHGTAFNGDLSIRYLNGIVDWSLKFGSSIKIKIWSLGTKRFDVAFKSIPFLKYIDVGADVYLEMGGTGGLTNGEGQADVFLGLSVNAVLGFFKEKAEKSDASIDARVYGRIHLVISYDGKYIRAGWYPEIGARAVIRLGKWLSWNWGDVWIPKDIPWPLYEYAVRTGSIRTYRSASTEDIPTTICNATDGGGNRNIFVGDAPDSPNQAIYLGKMYLETDNSEYVYPIYGSAMSGSSLKEGDTDFYEVEIPPIDDVVIYLKPEIADFDLFIYSPSGSLYRKSMEGGESVDSVVVPKEKLESWDGRIIIGVSHYYGDGVYIVSMGYLSSDEELYEPPTTILGSIVGDGYLGSHYNNYSSPAWKEIKIELEAGIAYRFTLEWNSESDLDLYLYELGKAPSIDGNGDDYVEASKTLNMPEVIEHTPNIGGVWIVAIDHYSSSGVASYTLKVEIMSGQNVTGDNTTFEPPCIIMGSLAGSYFGSHYNDPESQSWIEYKVKLQEGSEYRITLSWNDTSDLDLYLYEPNKAPSIDGDGDDYFARSFTSNNPESIEFTASTSGIWIVAVDHYSMEEETEFKVEVDIISSETNDSNVGLSEIVGTVVGDGEIGPHFDSPDSSAWNEHKVILSSGILYQIRLEWESYADLDLYIYKPNTAPSQDGSGDDYYKRAFTTNNPEIIELVPDITGEWVIAIDRYSSDGMTEYKIIITEISINESSGPIIIEGGIQGNGKSGPHYGDTTSWRVHTVHLEAGQYRITLSWQGDSDLDLYIYRPGQDPSSDGSGEDYYERAYTTNRPEILEVEIDQAGNWIIAIDHYSAYGSAAYQIKIEEISDTDYRHLGDENIGLPQNKDITSNVKDSDRDGIPDTVEQTVPLLDEHNALIPAIYPPIIVLLFVVFLAMKNRIILRKGKYV